MESPSKYTTIDKSLERFLNYMTVERGIADNTLSAYRNDLMSLQGFVETLPSSNISDEIWGGVTSDDMTTYVLDMHQRGYSDTTRARKVASLRAFFDFLIDEGVITSDPSENLNSPRLGRQLPDILELDEIESLLGSISRDGPENVRDRAMIELLYASGMRVSELVSIDLGDLELDQGFVRCLGKGSKERVIPIHDAAVTSIQNYLTESRPELETKKSDRAVFLNRKGMRLTRQGLWLILRKLAAEAGISKRITPHTIRHTFATHLLHGGAQLRHVQEILGHASISTTQVYTHMTTDHVRSEYEKSHPRAV